ncbi:hypothetical protein CCHOA_07480 [Corynebacterium choanae]|uniref:Uncharacterized protein n=1 Tax=Corynebacterium choanae TaxID=1862358 RepID=A0A3G6JAF1_9CORY|nr:hypothetical protein CCHOA_07480 [Corynebacterium choanae]
MPVPTGTRYQCAFPVNRKQVLWFSSQVWRHWHPAAVGALGLVLVQVQGLVQGLVLVRELAVRAVLALLGLAVAPAAAVNQRFLPLVLAP